MQPDERYLDILQNIEAGLKGLYDLTDSLVMYGLDNAKKL